MTVQQKRPVLSLPLSNFEMLIEIAAIAGVLLVLAITAIYWQALPDRVPAHFGLAGEPNRWAGKSQALLLPILASVMYVGMTILCRYPHIYNYPVPLTEENAERQYRIGRMLISSMRAETVWVAAFIQREMIRLGLGKADGISIWAFPAMVAIVVATAGVGIYKSYRAR
ncbi:MAG: DUF1648 domain-containing protein [Armatimonadetes bacterium]|nr:DUF1648 domain-containing protein [Armatimonadota bacterium]NIO76820.1 DUF1648 domain-containing protein [Armatimonadota bacterium]NIO97190.1 DUF1648 domain-containing protein [Armatimonadota bacterium]